jgi:hypothetical protein
MKTKLLLWGAVLFLALGLNVRDSVLCYFFAIHLFMLFIGVFVHKHTAVKQSGRKEEPLPKDAATAHE